MATVDAVILRGRESLASDPRRIDCNSMLPVALQRLRLGLAQLVEDGIGKHRDGQFLFAHDQFCSLDADELGTFSDRIRRADLSLKIGSTSSLGHESFGYTVAYLRGANRVAVERMGCCVRYGGHVALLDQSTFSLLEAIDQYHRLPPIERRGARAMGYFARVKTLSSSVAALLDRYLLSEAVVVPSKVGLDLIQDDQGRITFVPSFEGVPDQALRKAFLQLEDVDSAYTCQLEDGSRLRVVLDDDQREVIRRMQRVRRLAGADRAKVLRDPAAVFDGVAEAVDIRPDVFGSRVKGIGDFPFVARPFIQRSVTGIFEDIEGSGLSDGPRKAEAGIERSYADGHSERLTFDSPGELANLVERARDACAKGTRQIEFRGKTLSLDDALIRSLEELSSSLGFTKASPRDEQSSSRQYLLIYTNEDQLDYDEGISDGEVDQDLPQLPASLCADLKRHQIVGIEWLQRNFLLGRRGCLLADDMGLGKTLQTLAFIAWFIEKHFAPTPPWKPILIVAPVVLLENEVWLKDMRQFFSGAVFEPVITLHGANLKSLRRGGDAEIGPQLDLDRLKGYRVVVTNYETVTNYQHSFARMRDDWSVVICDEAQAIKTPSTKISHAVKSLEPRFRIGLTGTPVETRLLDVWNIFDFLHPGRLLSSAKEFTKRFERRVDSEDSGSSDAQIEDLRKLLKLDHRDAYILRREKGNELPDLPKKYEHTVEFQIPSDHYEQEREEIAKVKRGEHPFSIIPRLIQLSEHPSLIGKFALMPAADALRQSPKLQLLIKELKSIRNRLEKALIFTRTRNMQQILATVLGHELGLEVGIVNGETKRSTEADPRKPGTRRAIIDQFRQSPGFGVIILSPEVAGTGLTLVEANHVFHYGRWWNPATEAQATDRVYRIGQTKDVHVHYFVGKAPPGMPSSFDQKLDSLLSKRRRMAHDFLRPMPSPEDLQKELVAEVLES